MIHILSVLLIRDALEELLQAKISITGEQLLQISQLDDYLHRQKEIISEQLNLPELRKIINPPQERWWWLMTPTVIVSPWEKLNWFWKFLSLIFLAGFASLMTEILPLISADGVGVLESFGLVAPTAALAWLTSNMQEGNNKINADQDLSKIGIPRRFTCIFTCLVAALLFGCAFIAHRTLPDYYFRFFTAKGQQDYDSSRLLDAKEMFEKALKVPAQKVSSRAKVYTQLGLIYESVGDNDNAIHAYQEALKMGDQQALNNIGRVYIAQSDLGMAETYLKMGMERVDCNLTTHEPNYLLKYQLHRNLGWVYLQMQRYREAEWELNAAIKISRARLPSDVPGRGIAACFLAEVYELTDRPKESLIYWGRCRVLARPETIGEYRAIVKLKPSITEYIPTQKIF